jgi:hypothetical protein
MTKTPTSSEEDLETQNVGANGLVILEKKKPGTSALHIVQARPWLR